MTRKFVKAIAFVFTFLGIVTLFAIIYVGFTQEDIYIFGGKLDLAKGSNFGSLIGGFAGVFFTVAGVLLLYRTLQLQREEFSRTQKAITTQQFETTFFNMMNTLHGLLISIEGNDSSERGYSYVHNCLESLKDTINSEVGNKADNVYKKVASLKTILDTEFQSLESELSEAYNKFYELHHTQLGHYFRYLYNIMKYVFDNRTKHEEHVKYISLIQAQLSNAEMGLLFYNALSSKGKNSEGLKQFKIWLDDYSVLENLDVSSLQNEHHHILYKKTIFKFLSKDARNWKKIRNENCRMKN